MLSSRAYPDMMLNKKKDGSEMTRPRNREKFQITAVEGYLLKKKTSSHRLDFPKTYVSIYHSEGESGLGLMRELNARSFQDNGHNPKIEHRDQKDPRRDERRRGSSLARLSLFNATVRRGRTVVGLPSYKRFRSETYR